jgi:two-component system chemotaxis sensor kinase CheA
MSLNDDDELLEDFLVEAGEILEQLGEQLVELEHRGEDKDLLNAVFRGFHTIKGGAGFLNITSLVEICHRAEDVFNTLRQGDRIIDAPLMDAILRVLDDVNGMFTLVRNGEDPPPADRELIEKLMNYSLPAGKEGVSVVESVPVRPTETAETRESFRDIKGGDLPTVADASQQTGSITGAATDEFTDEEFEALLDQLHGKGNYPGNPFSNSSPSLHAAQSLDDEDVSDEEFEDLMDEIQDTDVLDSPAQDSVLETVVTPIAARAGAIAKPVQGSETSMPSRLRTRDASLSQSQTEATVRVDTKRLDDIMNLVGELVLVRNRLATLESAKIDEDMAKAVANLDLVTSDLQTSVMKTRMQPIKKVFGRFPRVVRDVARSLNKEVNLELIGEDTDLDKNLVEALADPLVHLVRNAVDHGIEMPEERVRAGKPRAGYVTLSAEQQGDHILLRIRDDGAGMDADKLRASAVAKGLMDEDAAARLSDAECYQLIFIAGFSTKEEISDISGRGVGMDVVKTRIAQLNGSLEIDSALGRGTQIAIKVPLTLAIMPTLMVQVVDQIFALPLGSVVEIFHLDLNKRNVVDGQDVILIREKAVPLFYLRSWLVNGHAAQLEYDYGHVVIVHVGQRHVGFIVDRLLGQEEVVIKPLGALLHGIEGLAGATITGNGRISLILDVPGLMSRYVN